MLQFRIFVEAIAIWQANTDIGNVVVSATLNAIGTCKSFSNNIYMLLETTVYHYFRSLGRIHFKQYAILVLNSIELLLFWAESKKEHSPSWANVVKRLGPMLPSFDLQQMFDGEHLLCIYISMVYKLKELQESGERITYLQNIGKMLENYKSTWAFELTFNYLCLISAENDLLKTVFLLLDWIQNQNWW